MTCGIQLGEGECHLFLNLGKSYGIEKGIWFMAEFGMKKGMCLKALK